MKIDENVFEKFKESENYIVYVEKKPVLKNQIDIIVKYKKNGRYMQCILTDALFKLFFQPEDLHRLFPHANLIGC